MKTTNLILILSSIALASCGAKTSSSSEVYSSQSSLSSETATSMSAATSETSVTEEKSLEESSEEETSIQESAQESVSEASSISSFESRSHTPGEGAWSLTSDALPQNPAQGKHYDLAFSVNNGAGDTVSFVGDAILKGGGSKNGVSIDNTIQLSKGEGMITMTAGSAIFITFEIVRIETNYGDFTGVPTIYSADSITKTTGEVVTLEREESGETGYIYSCMLPHSQFRLANESNNALYIRYLNNLG